MTTLVKIVQIMVIDNCMSDDEGFWAAYLKLSDDAQRGVLRRHFPGWNHDLLDLEAGCLSPDQAEVLAAGEVDQQRAVVLYASVQYLYDFLVVVFQWVAPDPSVLDEYGGGEVCG